MNVDVKFDSQNVDNIEISLINRDTFNSIDVVKMVNMKSVDNECYIVIWGKDEKNQIFASNGRELWFTRDMDVRERERINREIWLTVFEYYQGHQRDSESMEVDSPMEPEQMEFDSSESGTNGSPNRWK